MAMLTTSYPRVLLAHQFPFNQRDGGGLRMLNYFRDWPSDKIAQIYGPASDMTPEARASVDKSICQRYYLLNADEFSRRWPLSIHYRRKERGIQGDPHYPGPIAEGTDGHRVVDLVRKLGLTQPTRARISPELDRFISDFRPDLVFTALGSLAWVRLVAAIRRKYGAKSVVFINDDWMSDQFETGPYAARMRSVLHGELTALFRASAERFSICELMSDVYRERYGVEFTPLEATVDLGQWRCLPIDGREKKAAYTILYAGTVLEYAQLGSLRDASIAVEALADAGFPVRLVISTPAEFVRAIKPEFMRKGTSLVAYGDRNDVIRKTAEADLLLVPINFDEKSLRFVRYSMPGKLAAYMASGRPILVYGPPDVPPTLEAERYRFALTVTRRDQSALQTAIRRALTDNDLRLQLTSAARVRAEAKYDHDVVTTDFRQRLARAAQHVVSP